MRDGVRLAASLFVPDGDGPWPAVLEALPYRKDDETSSYRPEYERLAAAGYVVCRVDLRGTGSSEGIAEDEYPAVERTDMMTVIDWLATQEWSTGNVGMYGTSYSGFNSIQLAMERPPALKAIIPIYATDDRYADDVHYMGGAVKQLDQVDYPSSYRREYVRLADAGYVMCRVDVRGTGSSEGSRGRVPGGRAHRHADRDRLARDPGVVDRQRRHVRDELLRVQLDPARDGAAPALKAIIPIFATDDRYADDVHYFGGALKQLDLVDYPTYMVAHERAAARSRRSTATGWREEWERRVRGTEPWVLTWLEHQRFDDYWRFGSLRPDYDRDRGGDDDRRRVGRRLPEQLAADVRAAPLPDAIGDRPVGARVDRHVAARAEHRPRARDDPLVGPMAEGRGQRHRPRATDRAVRAAVHATRARPVRRCAAHGGTSRRGRPNGCVRRPLALADAHTDAPTDGGDDVLDVRGDVGWTAWISCAASLPWGQPDDQRPDEAYSLTYTWPALEHDLEILGHARLDGDAHVLGARSRTSPRSSATSSPTARRRSSRRNMLNLAHRDSREEPSPLEPGRRYEVTFDLEAASWTFEAGHRIRLDLAGHGLAERLVAAGARDAHDRPIRRDADAPGARRAVAGGGRAVVRAPRGVKERRAQPRAAVGTTGRSSTTCRPRRRARSSATTATTR